MPYGNQNVIDKKDFKTAKDIKTNHDTTEKSCEKNAYKNKEGHDKSQEKDSKAKDNKKESYEQKPYVRVRVIDASKETQKTKFNKVPLCLEVIYGCEGDPDCRTQIIPLPTQLSYSGKDVRFDGPAIGNIMGKFDSSTTTVLSGSTNKGNGAQLGSNVSVHVPSKAGDFYFELTPDGNVKLNKIPANLDVDITTFAKVETNQDLKCRKLKIHAKEYTNNHHVSAKTIEIRAEDKISNFAVMTADIVDLQTKNAITGSINNIKGKIESNVHMNLSSTNIHNAAKLCAKQGNIRIEKTTLLHNTKDAELSAQAKIEGMISHLNNEGQISAGVVKLTIIEKLKNFASGKISATQMIDLLAKELINSGEMTSDGLLKCQADTILQDSVTSKITSKAKLELITVVLMRNAGLLSAKDLHVTSINGTIENLLKAIMKSEGSATLNAATIKNAGDVLISERLEVLARILVDNAGTLSAKDLQVTSINGLVHNLVKGLMLGDKTTINAATVHNESDIIAKKGMLSIIASILLHNDKSAKVLSNDPLDIDAGKLINQGLLASASKTHVSVKEVLDNQISGVMTAQSSVAELCVNHTEKTNQELLKQLLEGRVSSGKDIKLTAGMGIQNAGKLSGGLITLISNLKAGFIRILENSSVTSEKDINLISKNADNAGDLTCINGSILAGSQLNKKLDEKIKQEKVEKEKHVQEAKEKQEKNAVSERQILKGKMPNSERVITFEENEVAKDGSCGFHALGVTRKEVIDLLLPHASDEKIRRELAPEIMNALGGNDIGSAATSTSKLLYKRYAECLALGPKLEAEANALIKKIYPNAPNRGLTNLIAYFKQFDKKSYAEMLKKLEDHLKFEQNCERERHQYACSEEAYISYIKSFGHEAWIGYKSARLVAMLKQINLYIWTSSTKKSGVVELRESYESAGNKNTIHMLHTSRFSHFNLLSEVDEKHSHEVKISQDLKQHKELKDGKESRELPAIAPKVEAVVPTNVIEPGTIFKNKKTGKLHAKLGGIDIAASKLLNRGSMDAGNQVLFNGQKFSHLEGKISAGTHVDVSAFNIKNLSDIHAENNIVLRHSGGLWEIADKLHAKGTVHFIWPEARTITQAFTLDGGIHYEILPTAKQPMHFLVNQLVKGDFSITAPSVNLTIGNDQHYVLLGADHDHSCQRMSFNAKCIYLCQGRISSMKKMLFKGETLCFGRCTGVLQRPSALGCNDDVEFDITYHVNWLYFEMWVTKDLIIKASDLANRSSNVIVEGNAILNTPSWHGLITEKGYGNCNRVGVVDRYAMIAFKILQEQAYVISKPAHFEVRGKLINLKPMTVFASSVHYGEFGGVQPTMLSFIPYEIWKRWHQYGNVDRPWWREFGETVVGAAIMGKLSICTVLKSSSPIINISGSVSAGSMEFNNVVYGKIGLTTKLALPAPPPFRPCISLSGKDTNTSLFEITGAGTYASVYRPIFPFQFSNEFGPILIVGADNHLRPNVNNRRCLYHPMQERGDYTKALMIELLRAFISPELTDPYKSMFVLRNNAEILCKSGKTYVSQDGSIPIPFIAYKEIEFINAVGAREMVVIPMLYLPKSLDNSLLRDGYGGLFSFVGILIQGANYPDTSLDITGTINASGTMTFKKLDTISHRTNMIEGIASLTHTQEISSLGGARVKTKHFQQDVTIYTRGRGNNITAASISYEDIPQLEFKGTTLTAGAGGVRTENIGKIEQNALLESRIEPEISNIRTLMSNVITSVHQHEATLIPTTVNSTGPVRLASQRALYDNMIINGKKVTRRSKDVSAKELTVGKTENDFKIEKDARRSKQFDDTERARRKELHALQGTIVVAAATAALAPVTESILGAVNVTNTIALAATNGAIAGAVTAAITKQNIPKSAAKGALLGGFGAGLSDGLNNLDLLKDADLLKKGMDVVANAGASAIVNKTNFVQELIGRGVNEVVKEVMPVSNERDAPKFPTNAVRTVTTAAITTAINGGDVMNAAVHAVAQSVGQALGGSIGKQVVAPFSDTNNRGANRTKDLKDLKERAEHEGGSAPTEMDKGVVPTAVFSGAAVTAVTGTDIMSKAGDALRKAQKKTTLPAAKKPVQATRQKSCDVLNELFEQFTEESTNRFLLSNTRCIRQSNSDRRISSNSGSGSGSTGSNRSTSNAALQNAVARLPLKLLHLAQSPADILNGTVLSWDDRMPQRQSCLIIPKRTLAEEFNHVIMSSRVEDGLSISTTVIQDIQAIRELIDNSSFFRSIRNAKKFILDNHEKNQQYCLKLEQDYGLPKSQSVCYENDAILRFMLGSVPETSVDSLLNYGTSAKRIWTGGTAMFNRGVQTASIVKDKVKSEALHAWTKFKFERIASNYSFSSRLKLVDHFKKHVIINKSGVQSVS